jgi:hypothetical protein
LLCTADPSKLLGIPLEILVEKGFAKCHKCQEPLRSIALVDCFRGTIEEMASNGRAFESSELGTGASLVQEAEGALARGQDCSKRNDSQRAILEYTHAINAINYLASASSGARLVLRAFDILLIAHSLRAELEDNQALSDAVILPHIQKHPSRAQALMSKFGMFQNLHTKHFSIRFKQT